MRIVALSDTHARQNQIPVPDGDVLIHCGDVDTGLEDFGSWLGEQPHRHVLMTWGNHDRQAASNPHEAAAIVRRAAEREVHILVNESVVLDRITFYGAPYSNPFCNWAFMPTEGEQFNLYRTIPDDADVVFNHGPPLGYGDRVVGGQHVGSLALRDRLWQVRPQHVFCGHIHEAYGDYKVGHTPYAVNETTVHNVSVLDEKYRVTNPCTVVDL